jgi:phosphomannomutase
MDRSLIEKVEAWRKADPDEGTARELAGLVAKGDEKELADRFSGVLEFGTAGLRGVIGGGPNRMNRAVVRRTTAGLARYLKRTVPQLVAKGVVVARDGRRMSEEFARDAASVLCAEGIPVHFFDGVAPTPVCAFAVTRLGAAAGVMVTASHNPPEYNGYKVYWGNGAQIIPPHDKGIAAEIDRVEAAKDVKLTPEASARQSGQWRSIGPEMDRAYVDAILALRVHPESKGKDLNIVYTAMHGVGGRWIVDAFARAGFKNLHTVSEQQEPDGAFPTVRFPNPEEKGAMDLSRALAEKVKAELVIANDPDADRLAVLARAKNGKLLALTGNEVGVLLGHYLLTERKVPRPMVATTIVSSTQLRAMAKTLGAAYSETLTGFKWIANRAIERLAGEGLDFLMGYEEALGYTVGTVVRDKDGIGAALVFADLAASCREKGQTVLDRLEEIQRRFGLYASYQHNVTLPGAAGQATISKIMEGFRARPPGAIAGKKVVRATDYAPGHEGLPPSNVVAYELEDATQITLRPSGTEPKIKYYFEVKEPLQGDEAAAKGRERAQGRIDSLVKAFLELAYERGQPR